MASSLVTKRIPWWLALITVGAFASGLYGFSNKAIGDAQPETKANVWSTDDCLKCHRTPEAIQKMQSKRGNSSYCKAELSELLATRKQAKSAEAANKTQNYNKSW